MYKLIVKYHFINLKRNVLQSLLLLFVMACGVYAIAYGARETARQRAVIAVINEKGQQQTITIKANFIADTTTTEGKKAYQTSALPGFGWHRHQYPVVFSASALAPLAIGQRDLQPYYYSLSASSLYYQLFQNEIANPQQLLVGNFDLSFVIVYLFPLLIITLCYNLLSAESERGMLVLLKSQAYPLYRIIVWRLVANLVMVLAMATALSLAGFAVCRVSLPLDLAAMLSWMAVVTTYIFLWFSLLLLIISLNKNSVVNALLAVGVWLVFLILIPAAVNIAITLKMPLNSNVLAGISRRTGVFDEEKEENQQAVIREFLASNPMYNHGKETFRANLNAKGFAAFTFLKDKKAAMQVANYQHQVNTRDKLASRFEVINPAVNAQKLFNAIAETDLSAYQQFYHAVRRFHHQLVHFYFKKIFSDGQFQPAGYENLPRFSLAVNKSSDKIVFGVLYLFVSAILFCFFGLFLIRRCLTKAT